MLKPWERYKHEEIIRRMNPKPGQKLDFHCTLITPEEALSYDQYDRNIQDGLV